MFINFKSKIIKYHFFTALILISFSLFAGNCDKTTEPQPNTLEELIGNWELSTQTGALQDICPGETVNFQSNGIALLKCPNTDIISREYSVENYVLTYIQSDIIYDIDIINSDTLYLIGNNVSRNLLYLKIQASENLNSNIKDSDQINSSEKR